MKFWLFANSFVRACDEKEILRCTKIYLVYGMMNGDYPGLNDVPEESAPTEVTLLIASQRIALEGKA